MRTITGFCLAVLLQAANALDAPIHLTEPNVVARSGEGISCGVPFKKGDITDLGQISLFDGATEVPAQFDLLTSYEDGTPMWVLASFLSDIGRNASKQFAVRTVAPTVSPARAVAVRRSGSVIEIDNGTLRFQVDTVNFTGIDSLYYDGAAYFGGKNGGLVLDNAKDSLRYANGPVTRAGFLYLGALRATLRVEGVFFKKTCGGLGYSCVITTYAGSPRLEVDVTIRNSISESCGDVARIRRASMVFPLLFTPDTETAYKFNTFATARPEIRNFSATGKSVTLQEEWNGGVYGHVEMSVGASYLHHNIFRDSGFLGADIIVEKTAGIADGKDRGYEGAACDWYWLADGSSKSSRLLLTFGASGRSAAELAQDFVLNKSPLMARPDPALASASGVYGIHKDFGTLEDEVQAWRNFGKTTDGVAAPSQPRDLQASRCIFVGTLHFDMEDDPGEQWLLQWLRTDGRGFLDQAQAWMRFGRTNMTFRTTGFDYDGYNSVKSMPTSRTMAYLPDDYRGAKESYHSMVDFNDWGCHMSGWGLVNWYCLTGDVEAREAAEDLSEIAWTFCRYYAGLMPGGPASLGAPLTAPYFTDKGYGIINRGVTRHFLQMMSMQSVLKRADPLWKARTALAAEYYLNAWNVDPRGFFFGFSTLKTMNGDTNVYYQPARAKTSEYAGWWPDRLRQCITDSQISFVEGTLPAGGYEGRTSSLVEKIMYAQRPAGAGDTVKWIPKHESTGWSAGLFCYEPLAQYFRLTGDEDARDMIIGCGQAMACSPLVFDRCGLTQDGSLVDFPFIGHSEYAQGHSELSGGDAANPVGFSNLNAEHDKCVGAWGTADHSMAIHNGSMAVQLVQVMALAYGYTGRSQILQKAFETWNRGIKRPYFSSSYSAPENVMRYAFVTGENNGDNQFIGGLSLFHEASRHTDSAAPDAIADLDVAPAEGRPGFLYAAFTVPPANSGALAEYQLKFDTVPIVDYEDFDFRTDYLLPCGGVKRAPWWYAKNVPDEAVPAASPGNLEKFAVSTDILTGLNYDTLYFALACRNSNGNLSLVSNNARFWDSKPPISSENAALDARVFSLSAGPNPFNPATLLRYRFNGSAPAALKIYDVRGRLVKDLSGLLRKAPADGQVSGQIAWNGTDAGNRAAASGLYLARLTCGNRVLERKLSLIK